MASILFMFSLFGLFSRELSPAQKSGKITQQFATEFQKEHNFADGLKFAAGLGRRTEWSKSCLFVGHQELTLETVRPLAQACIQQLKERLRTNKEDKDCFGGNLVWTSSVRMNFWTKNWDRVAPPYIAEVKAHHGKIYYYQAVPKTQELILVHEEPYDYLEKEGLAPVDPTVVPALLPDEV